MSPHQGVGSDWQLPSWFWASLCEGDDVPSDNAPTQWDPKDCRGVVVRFLPSDHAPVSATECAPVRAE